MNWSAKRKVMILGILGLIVFVVSGSVAYFGFIRKTPTCSDGKQNQNERGIDCGGICSRMCVADSRSLVRLWARAFPIAPGVYNAVAYVENQNVRAGSRRVRYELRLYDDQNVLAAEPVIGETFIGPNERTAIFEPSIVTGNRRVGSVFFKLLSDPAWERTDEKFSSPQLVTSNIQISDTQTLPKLRATLENPTLEPIRQIEVVAVLYDEMGNAINASRTYIDALPAGGQAPLAFTWQAPFGSDVARVELVPRINPFVQ
jgi:hypothetical protein